MTIIKNILTAFFLILGINYGSAQATENPASSDCVAKIKSCERDILDFAAEYLPAATPGCKLWNGTCDTKNQIWRAGIVGIGMPLTFGFSGSCTSASLTVKGGIRTEELQICKVGWCDFVFEDTFRLKPLTEVRNFIHVNKHLPDCTPGSEVTAAGGCSIEEQAYQQQRKIEEAYLHLFQLNHRLKTLGTYFKIPKNGEANDPSTTFMEEIIPVEFNSEKAPNATIECFELRSATSLTLSDGLAGVDIQGATGPFTITWSGIVSGSIQNVNCDGIVKIPNLKAGTYQFTVIGPQGVSLGVCSTIITVGTLDVSVCNELYKFESPCAKELVKLLDKAYDKGTFGPQDCVQWEGSACSLNDAIYREGNVVIGTSIGQSGFKLAVGGGIDTDHFMVELCDGVWCDYVFEPDYPIMPLEAVEKYVQQNKHLPEMTSQSDIMRDGGLRVKKVKLEQQVKIEELYLYLIEMDKEINQLQQFIQQHQ